MIKEFSPSDIAYGVHEALMGDAAVIRGIIDPEQASDIARLVPEKGKRRIYLSPSLLVEPVLKIPNIEKSRAEVNRIVAEHLGSSATLWNAYGLRPDMLRAGKTKPHLDGRGSVVSGSLNLDPGASSQTVFFARRLGPSNAAYSEIEASWEQNDIPVEQMASCELGVGDMVIVARGAIHGSIAPTDRRSITYRTRGIVAGDLR